MFKPGDHVEKIKGYKWPGVILASFSTTHGEHRLVVECPVPEVAGALHIYAPEQLRLVDEQGSTDREYDPDIAPCDDAEFGMKP